MDKILIASTIIFLFVLLLLIFAQPALPESPNQAPIDGGLGILAVLGGTYAIKKLRASKKAQLNTSPKQ